MTGLVTTANLPQADAIYDRLIALHDHLDDSACRIMDARLILILMNHIGNEEVIFQALDLAGRRPDRLPAGAHDASKRIR